tara:strand:- start:1 stop:1029 length:1029 start_codon:yes stop_codon:yes gene_type:complete
MCVVFFSLGLVINLFEEINFFKDYNEGIRLPLYLSILFVPSLLYNMLPFVFLLSGIYFFLKFKKTDEVIALKISGMSNFSIILVPAFLSVVLGIFFITSINPITAALVKKYESIKGSYERDQEYLASITVNGIWIKEKNLLKNNIIKAAKLKKEELINVTIYEFDKQSNFQRRIEAESADISSLNWTLRNVKIIDSEGNYISENVNQIQYISMYDIKKIKSLYSNLDTVSFWSLKDEIQLLKERGYSTREMNAKLQRSFAFPFFLLSMILLGGFFTLGHRLKDNNWRYVFIAIISSVIIFYFNDFSAALGKTDKLPVEVSVWMPILVIFIFSAAGLIHANQK